MQTVRMNRACKQINALMLLLFLVLLLPVSKILCERNFNEYEELVFGQSCALTGPSAALGTQLTLGIKAAFNEINLLGGVFGGKKLKLITIDDYYEPGPALNNTIQLLQNPDLFSLIGYMGTPTTTGALSTILAADMSIIGAYTGTTAIREPFNHNIINIRPSYYDETAAIVNYLVNERLITRISVLYQNDAFGISGRDGLVKGLTALNLKVLSEGTYPRNTIAVEQAVIDISKGRPSAIVLIATSNPAAAFVNLVKKSNLYPNKDTLLFITPSPAGLNVFADALGNAEARKNIIITQVVPPPTDKSVPLVRNYNRAIAAIDPAAQPGFVSLEGYIAGKLVYNVLQRVAGNLTRTNFLRALYNSDAIYVDSIKLGPYSRCDAASIYDDAFGMNLNGTKYNSTCYSCNQGISTIWPTHIVTDNNTGHYEYQKTGNQFSWSGTCLADSKTLTRPFIFGQSSDITNALSESFTFGIRAAFQEYNRISGTKRRKLELLTFSHYDNTSLVSNFHELVDDNNVFALIGFTGSQVHDSIIPLLGTDGYSSIPLIGSNSGSTREFLKNVINIRMSWKEELGAIIQHVLFTSKTRISLIYSKEHSNTKDVLEMILGTQNLEMESSLEIDPDQLGSQHYLDSQFKEFASLGNPQVVIFSGTNESVVIRFIESINNLYLRDDIVVACISTINTAAISQAIGANLKDVVLLGSFVVPDPSDLSKTVAASFADTLTYIDRKISGVNEFAALEGYIVGRSVTSAMQFISDAEATPAKLLETFYLQKSLYVNNIKLGMFQTMNTTGSNCNLGMREVYLIEYTSDASPKRSSFSYPASTCGLETLESIDSSINKPYIFAQIRSEEEPLTDFEQGFSSFVQYWNDKKGTEDAKISHLIVPLPTGKSVKDVAEELLLKYKVFGIVGVHANQNVTGLYEFVLTNKIPLIAPVSGSNSIREPYNKYIINLRPSILDEAIAFSSYLHGLPIKPVLAVVYDRNSEYWSVEAQSFLKFAKRDTAHALSVDKTLGFDATNLAEITESISNYKVDSIFILADSNTTATIVRMLAALDVVKHLGLTSEVATTQSFYRSLVGASSSVTEKLIVSQLLPVEVNSRSLTGTSNSTIDFSKQFSSIYDTYYPDQYPSMQAYEGFLAGQFVSTAFKDLQANAKQSPEEFLNELYSISNFDFQGYKLGPIGLECVKSNKQSLCAEITEGCGCNQAARKLFVSKTAQITAQGVIYSALSEFSFNGCGVEPVPKKPKSIVFIWGVLAAVVTLSVVGIAALIFIGVYCYRSSAKLKYAPKKSGTMVCVFTDIQNSTTLWQSDQSAMKQALVTHNKIMRDALLVFRGYEVKTVGDSFMCAFKRPIDALDWAIMVQHALLQATWPVALLNQYDCRQEWNDTTKTLLWNGLRVRMGLNFGYSEFVIDKHTKRPDYFGTTINAAARIESIANGGQVLISDSMFRRCRHAFGNEKLRDDNPLSTMSTDSDNMSSYSEDTMVYSMNSGVTDATIGTTASTKEKRVKAARVFKYNAVDLGEVELKGLSGLTRVYQVTSDLIDKRRYPSLQLHKQPTAVILDVPHSKNSILPINSPSDVYSPDGLSESEVPLVGSRYPASPETLSEIHRMSKILELDGEVPENFEEGM